MRYALISDIHANLEAFQAVLGVLSKERIDSYLFIGDVVSYGVDPKICIKLLKDLKPRAFIAGNHEWGVLGLFGLENFTELARYSVIWTKGVLNEEEMDFLRSFQLVYEEKDFTLVHGSLERAEKFYYIFNASDAYATMKLSNTSLCFVGHSHIPAIFSLEENYIKHILPPKTKIDCRKKYVINIGSVGQSRDRDPRASCAIYDDRAETVEIVRVEYDVETACEKILKAGLPEELGYRLLEGR